MKPQDILVVLKLGTLGDELWSYSGIAKAVGISVGEAHHCVERLQIAELLLPRYPDRAAPRRAIYHAGIDIGVARAAVMEFLVHGFRYVYPPEYVGLTRGVPTANSAPGLETVLAAPSMPIVWPLATGEVRGQALVPFYASVPKAALRDAALYRVLALAELLRVGSSRERGVAADALKAALKS